jgi:hypothetical protein
MDPTAGKAERCTGELYAIELFRSMDSRLVQSPVPYSRERSPTGTVRTVFMAIPCKESPMKFGAPDGI